MGAAAALAHRIILTSDNPRNEDPKAIALAIKAGLPGKREVEIELDRAQAIRRAILEAKSEDCIILAGKGHEQEQIVGTERRHFSDQEVARKAHAQRRSVDPLEHRE